MTQVYDILDKVRDKLRDNPNVFTVTFGDISEVDLNKTTIFPLSHLTITNVTFERSVINFTIALMCIDIVDYNKEKYDDDIFYGNTNLQDVYNTQLAVVNDLQSHLRRGDLYESDDLHLGVDVSAEPFQDKFENKLAGWGITLNIELPNNDFSICE